MNAAPPPVVPGLERPEPVGRGGFGTVFVADEPAFGRRVAVKVLAARIGDDEARRGFERECQAMGALSSHPHIVTVHRGGATEVGQPYIVMDFMTGGSLADRLTERGPLPHREALEVGVLIAGALETAHRAGILHLDVKPANVLVSRFAEPALGDFGISHLPGVTVTMDGVVRATATYSAPERLVGGEATVATDLYALGATLFALLTGGPAFAGETGEDIVVTAARVIRDPVPDLRSRGVPGALADVVERLMAKEPGDRPGTALEAATLLQAAQRSAGHEVTRPVVEGARPEHPPTAPPLPVPVVRPADGRRSLPPSWPPEPARGPDRHPQAAPPGGPVPWRPDQQSAGVPTAAMPAAAPAVPWRPAPSAPPGHPSGHPARRPPARRRGGQGWLIGVVAAALVVVVGAVAAFVLLRPSRGGVVPTTVATPPPSSTAPPSQGVPSAAAAPSALAIAPGLTDSATDEVARVLDAYVAGINDRRYADSFALFTPDNPTARKGLAAWVDAESTTQIRDARLVSVRSGAAGTVTAEMTFTSTQEAALGFNGQTCSTWDLVYDMTGPAPDWRIHLARTRGDPKAC